MVCRLLIDGRCWLLVACWWLFGVRCLLLVVGGVLNVVVGWLLVAGCWFLIVGS